MNIADKGLEKGGNGGLLVVLGPDEQGPQAALQLPVRLEQQLSLQRDVEGALKLLVGDFRICWQFRENLPNKMFNVCIIIVSQKSIVGQKEDD